MSSQVSAAKIKKAVFELGWFFNDGSSVMGLRSNWIALVAQSFGSGNSGACHAFAERDEWSVPNIAPLHGSVALGIDETDRDDTRVAVAGRHRRIRNAILACSSRTGAILFAAYEHDPRLAPLSGASVLGELAGVAIQFLPKIGSRRIRSAVARNDRKEIERVKKAAAAILHAALVEFVVASERLEHERRTPARECLEEAFGASGASDDGSESQEAFLAPPRGKRKGIAS